MRQSTSTAPARVPASQRHAQGRPALSDSDLLRWGRVACERPASRGEFAAWLAGPVTEFFPCRHVLVAQWEHFAGEVRVAQWLEAGDPDAGPGEPADAFELDAQPLLGQWMRRPQPLCIDPADPPEFASISERALLARMGRTAVHGLVGARARNATHLRFSGVPHAFTNWHGAALAMMAPLLHALAQQLLPVGDDASIGSIAQLTRRQREIVRAVARGHDDKSIARTMGISDKTVRNQLSEVYGLLGLSRRTQLAALLI